MNIEQFNDGLLQFIAASPTPFHAVANLSKSLESAGYLALDEAMAWQLAPGGRYYVTRNSSSIIAFSLPDSGARLQNIATGVCLVGAHTDSPCLRIKPQPDMRKNNYVQLGVEVYGGALLGPWFDRDLSIAGRVYCINEDQSLDSCLLDLRKAVACIPSLAIHLDRDVNQNRSINPQKDLPPILSVVGVRDSSFDDFLLDWIRHHCDKPSAQRILSYELSLYDTQPPAVIGLHDEFIASARLDNLLSCYLGLQALLVGESSNCNMLICSDHEEIGSASAAGAQGPFLRAVLERIIESVSPEVGKRTEEFERLIHSSMLLSIDNAHGVHPNFMEKHDDNHGPVLNQGPVIKINANQRYASNSRSVALFKTLCLQEHVPFQSFVVRSDMGCGSTIGPITATGIGIETVDIGVPTFAMHSIRELAGSTDAFNLYKVVQRFFRSAVISS
jgi:aspartyl aminopeptidase